MKFDMLHGTYIDAKSSSYDWFEMEIGNNWEFFEAVECENENDDGEICGAWAVIECGKCGGDVEMGDGPMMSYYYPVDFKRVGGIVSAARILAGLPVCPVMVRTGEGPLDVGDTEYGLAFTGGGMDLSWEMCEAYIRLGYLPPVHFYDLPHMAGMVWDDRTKAVVRAMNNALEMVRDRVNRGIRSVAVTERWLQDTEEERNATGA